MLSLLSCFVGGLLVCLLVLLAWFACVDPDDMDRRWLAKVTWHCEFLAFLLTCLYTAIVVSDVLQGGAHLTSPTWYKEGFCVWRGAHGASSHTLCTRFDLPVSAILALTNWLNYRRQKDSGLRIGLVVTIAGALFSILHGLGHWVIDQVGGDLAQLSGSAHTATWPVFLMVYFAVLSFLAIGPFVGYMFGVPLLTCVLMHFPSCWAFMYLPPQFAFGGVQLCINFWYCIPRFVLIGCEEDDAIAKRVDNGWAVNSIGIFLLMAVVFSEAFACDTFYQKLGGHVLYDGSILVLLGVSTFVLWIEGARVKKED